MAEFARGGIVDSSKASMVVLSGCMNEGYVIPNEFAKAWAKGILDRINEGLDKPDEDVVD